MEVKLSFLGAAQNVTGSRYLLEVNGSKILIDCGLYQERQFLNRNWDPFPVDARSIDSVLLTHAHLDHCGMIPKLVREGFKGNIYCTKATAEIVEIILLDSAHIQVEDAERKAKRHKKEGRKGPYPEVPLYTIEDVEASLPLFKPVGYRQSVDISDDVEATFYDAGHVLGSSIIKVKVRQDGQERVIIFSGDIGRTKHAIVGDTAVFEEADYVLVESTYGDRLHDDKRDIKTRIGEVINSTLKAGGNIVVPSFALERSQEILYYLNQLHHEKAIPSLKVFLDSPMASKITKVFEVHPELFDKLMTESVNNKESLFTLPGLQMAGTVDESKAINDVRRGAMIIAGSGMCSGGRIKYHLVNNITRPECTIMFVGYQAAGTLGRSILDKPAEVRIFGQLYPVKANIVRVNGFSAHADRDELLVWLKSLKTAPRKIFVVHGEGESAKSFGDYIREKTGWEVLVPAYQEKVILN